MTVLHSDALVFFGATGDLAHKQIFPALQAMVKRGRLDLPIIGVASPAGAWSSCASACTDSLEQHGGVDARRPSRKLCAPLRYVDGDYSDDAHL